MVSKSCCVGVTVSWGLLGEENGKEPRFLWLETLCSLMLPGPEDFTKYFLDVTHDVFTPGLSTFLLPCRRKLWEKNTAAAIVNQISKMALNLLFLPRYIMTSSQKRNDSVFVTNWISRTSYGSERAKKCGLSFTTILDIMDDLIPLRILCGLWTNEIFLRPKKQS